MASRTRTATVWILIAITIVLIVWDIWVAVEPTDGDTISEVVLGWARRTPALPFAVGFLCGHLFWPQS
jgi:hypothetical protein